jgi:hypothetical protein
MNNWLKRIWAWTKEASMLWLAVTVIIGSLIVAFLPTVNESRIRVVGLVLQLCGILTVAWGIAETRKFFGRPSVFTIARNWIKHFPKFRRNTVLGAANITLGASTLSARGYVWSNPKPGASLEERVSVLEKNLDRIKDTTYEVQCQLDKEVRSRESSIVSERQSREQADQEIRNKLEATETGGLNLSLIGIVWLSVGLILSTVPTEIIHLFN